MAKNLFKIRYLPNQDGTESSTVLNNTNTVFVHTYLGDDSTGNGTREYPYRSMNKAIITSGVSYVVFRGLINEAISMTNIPIIGDDINQFISGKIYSVGILNPYNLTSDILSSHNPKCSIITDYINLGVYTSNSVNFCLINLSPYDPSYVTYNNCTISRLILGLQPALTMTSSIISNVFDTNHNGVNECTVKNIIFLSTTLFKFNGNTIQTPNWVNDSQINIGLLITALTNAGMNSAAARSLFYVDPLFGTETCRIIKQQKDGGIAANVFNRYDSNQSTTLSSAILAGNKTSISVVSTNGFPSTGEIFIGTEGFYYTSITPTSFVGDNQILIAHNNNDSVILYGSPSDWTLNIDSANEALYASSVNGYVGCFLPSRAINSTIDAYFIEDVNSIGIATANVPDMIIKNADESIIFQTSATGQQWNRINNNVTISIKNGTQFKGVSALSTDGTAFGYYFGKQQNLLDAIGLYEGDALNVGEIYKVCNVLHDATHAIVYNGVQYLPDYFFRCITGVTTFALVNPGSGTTVKKLIGCPFESMEIIPYDDLTTPSVFLPKFSAQFMRECMMLFYTAAGAIRYGKISGNPVLFADLAGINFQTDFPNISNKISYYDTWGITNADQEFRYLLDPALIAPLNTYFTASVPILLYFRWELNGQFNAIYDF